MIDKVVQRKWLVPLFAGAAVVFFVLGYGLHTSAQPPDVAAVQRGGQVVDLSVFTSDPDKYVQIDAFVEASANGTPTYTAQLLVDPGTSPYDVLITSSIPDTKHLFAKMKFNQSNFVGVVSPDLYYYVTTSQKIDELHDLEFRLPAKSYFDGKGTLVVRLPTVGLQDQDDESFGSAPIPAGFAGSSRNVDTVSLKPGRPVNSLSPADYEDYVSPPGDPLGVIYKAPVVTQFHSWVYFSDQYYGMAGAQIQANSPSNGIFDGQSFKWSGNYGLEPYLSLVQPDELERRSSDDFLSGILLASAAAALIAFFQEVPDAVKTSRWLVRRRAPRVERARTNYSGAGSPPPYRERHPVRPPGPDPAQPGEKGPT